MAVQERQTEDPEFITPREYAARVRTTRRTIQRWAHDGYGPKPIRLRGRVLYRSADLRDWLKRLQDSAEQEA